MRKRRRFTEDLGPPPQPEASGDLAAECVLDLDGPHQLEQLVQRQLMGHPRLRFSSLVVRRIRDGVCLEGVLEADDNVPNVPDVTRLAQRVAGVQTVLNHLVVRRRPPKKG